MKIAVMLKQVPDLVEDLEVDASGISLDTDDIKFRNIFKIDTEHR